MITTMPTLEHLTRTVGLTAHRMNVQALMASLRSICRVNSNHSDPIFQTLVAQEHSQLEECPTITPSAFMPLTFAVFRFAPTLAQTLTARLALKPK
jgi:hypothetical protein